MKFPKELRDKKDLGKTAGKSKQCSINDCYESAIRSLSENKWGKYLEKAGFKVDENKLHKIYLCKKHYSEANKIRKSQEKIYMRKGFLEDNPASRKGQWD